MAAMFEDTRPADLSPLTGASGIDPWAEFRVSHPHDRLRLLKELRDGNVPLMLNTPDGGTLTTTVWAVDAERQCLNLSVSAGAGQLARVVDADEAVAVAYLESVKLQFDLHGLVLVRGAQASTLQCALPPHIYRLQRRGAYRVRVPERLRSLARLRHPSLPEMTLSLRVLDVSIGGCALWLPADVPPLQPATLIGEARLQLDEETHFAAAVTVQHVSAITGTDGAAAQGVRLGCEWHRLGGGNERLLQRWIDRSQQRRNLLVAG